jgi:hypothetical protein
LITANCEACVLELPVDVFSNALSDDPTGLLVSVVPGRLNSEEISELEEFCEVPDTIELSVCEMAY